MLGGGDPAREASTENTRSDNAGVDGRLLGIEDIEGCRELYLANGKLGRNPDFSVVAEAGVGSAFCVVPVVSRSVLGLDIEVRDTSEAAVAGVAGLE
jgi:hypothetical protein